MRTVDKQKESAPESESAPTRCRRPGYPVRMTLCAESLRRSGARLYNSREFAFIRG
jgi:hypothetical protein